MKMKRRRCNGEEEEVGEVEVASARKRAVKKTSGFEMQLHVSFFFLSLQILCDSLLSPLSHEPTFYLFYYSF